MRHQGDAQPRRDGQAPEERPLTGKATAFLDGLGSGARELLLGAARPVSFTRGSLLARHGDPARGAFVLRQGLVEAYVPAPGGEEMVVGTLGAGDILGEMALVEAGTCVANVRATGNVDGWFIAREDFRALSVQRSAAARELQHAVTLVLARRLDLLNARLSALDCAEDRPGRTLPAGRDPLAALPRARRASWDLPAFLPRLAFFQSFQPDEIDEVAAAARILDLPAGAALHVAGAEASAVFVLVRGAVEIVRPRGALERRLAVLGPGRPFGYIGVLLAAHHGSHAFAREAATVLEIPAAAFTALYFGEDACGTRLRAAVQRHLLESLGRTNRVLTRLASLARLREAGGEANDWEAAGRAALAGAVQSR